MYALEELLLAFHLSPAQSHFLRALLRCTDGSDMQEPSLEEIHELMKRHLIERQGRSLFVTALGNAMVEAIDALSHKE